jgi:integrase
MPTTRLSKRIVDALKPQARPYITFDKDLSGFGIRVMPSGLKTWIVEYRPGAGGRRVAKRRLKIEAANKTTAEAARSQAKEILARVRLGEDPAAARAARLAAPTVTEFAQSFLEEIFSSPRFKLTTRRLYSHNLRRFVIPALGSLKLDAVVGPDIARLHNKIGKAAPTAANNMLVTLSSLYRYAGEIGAVKKGFNPVRDAASKHKTQKRERFLGFEEMQRLADALSQVEQRGLSWRLKQNLDEARAKHRAKVDRQKIEVSPFVIGAIRLLLFTGCRRTEILMLRWSEVDFERGVLNLEDSKTGRKTVVLNGPALTILSGLPRAGRYVIAGNDPDAPRPDITQQWHRIRALAGLDGADGKPPFRLHDFRHSFASVGVGAGMGLPIVGKLLGHSQAATTHRYAHLDVDPLRRAVNSIGDTITAAMTNPGRSA